MDAPDGFPQHVGHGKHLQLREDPVVRDGNAVGHHHLLKQPLNRQALTGWR